MKKLLLLLTNYRTAEKIIGCIPKLSEHFKIDVYLIGQMSTKTIWPGDNDLRQVFLDNNSQYFENVIIGSGISSFGMPVIDLMNYINLKNYDTILYDDNRKLDSYQIPILYREAKSLGIPVVGNSHGNQEFDKSHISGIGISYDYCFVLGEKEQEFYSQYYEKSELLVGGIPTNDSLKNNKKTNDYILCITNFLANHNPLIFPVNFDTKWADLLKHISTKYHKKIIIKQKGRLDDPEYGKNISYINNLMDGCNYEIISDTKNIDNLISGASFVISALSTLAFKPIQMQIPTILIKESGQVGNFKDYPFISTLEPSDFDLNYNKMTSIDLKHFRDEYLFGWIKKTIEGGIDFSSTYKYINEIKKITYNLK